MRLLNFFRRTPDPQAEIFAEALALYEEGVEIADILARYPAEAREWLRPLLSTGVIIGGAFQEEEASYYFEGSLKAKALAAGAVEPVVGGAPVPPLPAPARFGQFGAAIASVAVLAVAGMLGVLTFGFVTAGDSVPGEWNYGFKRATEQAQVRFARGDERIDVHISQAQERIEEIQTLVSRGDLSPGHIVSFTDELRDIRELAEEEPFDRLQQAKVSSLSETAEVVLADVSEAEEEIGPVAAEAIDQAHQVAAAVSGGGDSAPLEDLDSTPAATPPATATTTPDPGTPAATETPAADPSQDGDGTVSTGEVDDPQPLDGDAPESTPSPAADPTVSPGEVDDPQPLGDPTEGPGSGPAPDGGDDDEDEGGGSEGGDEGQGAQEGAAP